MGNCACLHVSRTVSDVNHQDAAVTDATIVPKATSTSGVNDHYNGRDTNFMKVKSISHCEPTTSSLSQHSPRSIYDDTHTSNKAATCTLSNQNTSTFSTDQTLQDSPALHGDDADNAAEVVAIDHTVSLEHHTSEHNLPVQLATTAEHRSAHSDDTQLAGDKQSSSTHIRTQPRTRRANTVYAFLTRGSRSPPDINSDHDHEDVPTRSSTRTRSLSSFKTKLTRKDTLRSMINFMHHHASKSSQQQLDETTSADASAQNNDDEDAAVFVEPLQAKLQYTRNTPISTLELCILSGDVHGLMSELKHYEKEYAPFFMEYSNELGQTLLMKAAFLGHFNILRFLIGKYTQYKNAVFENVEPLMGKDLAALMLEFMGDYLNYECLAGKSALIFACSSKQRSRMNTVRYLLDNGASVTQPKYSEHGKAPILHAVQWKQQNLIDLLLEFGADINVQDRYNGYTPLMYAAKFNDRDLCEFLLTRGADTAIVNKSEKSAIDLAVNDECWAALLALDRLKVPPNMVKLANTGSPKNRWGRYSLSHSYF